MSSNNQLQNQITNAQSQISLNNTRIINARRQINNNMEAIADLRALLSRLRNVQTQNIHDTNQYRQDMDVYGECVHKIGQIEHVRVATWCTRELNKRVNGSARDAADIAISQLPNLIENEIERVEQEIRTRDSLISSLQGQISGWSNQNSNWNSQLATWRSQIT